jgi:hypothetical protein
MDKRTTLAALCAATVATPALAGIMVFDNRAAWEAALGGATAVVEDFNALTPQIIANGATLDTGLLQITRDGSPNGGDGLLEIEPGGNFGNFDGTTFISGETGAAPHENVVVEFNGQNVFAFGADWVSPFSGDGIVLNFGTYTVSLDSITGFNSGFLGFVATGESFSSVTISGTEDDITFQELWSGDNFSYAVPAPGTLALLGVGGLAFRRRR